MSCSSVERVNSHTCGGEGELKGQRIIEDKQKAGREGAEPKGWEARYMEARAPGGHTLFSMNRCGAPGIVRPYG